MGTHGKQRLHDVLFVKICIMWGLVMWSEAVEWDAQHDRLSGVLWVLTCLTTTVFILIRIGVVNDAWREGYKTALDDTGARRELSGTANVSRLRR